MTKFKILIVEDETPKRNKIKNYLSGFSIKIDVSEASSVNAALDALEGDLPDLMLLDMSLPTFEVGGQEGGGRPQVLGGVEILRHMMLEGISCPTVVISGYEAFPGKGSKPVELAEIREELKQKFPHFLQGVLHYNSTYDEWKTELAKILAVFGMTRESGA